MENSNSSVENYLQAIDKFISLGGSKKFWAFAPGQVDSYFIDIFSVNLFEKFLKNRNLFKKALGTLETNILRWYALPYVILGLKLANKYEGYNATAKDMSDYILAVEGVLREKVSSDPFCQDGQSKIMTDEEVKKRLDKIYLFKPEDKKQITILSSVLQSYIWSIEFDSFAYGAEWHGPYLFNSNFVVGKTYHSLNTPIWDISGNPEKIEIFYLLKEAVDWKVDIMEIATFQPDFWEKLESVVVLVDGKPVESLEEVQNLSEKFAKIRDKQVEIIDNLPPEEIIKKGIEVYYFMFMSFFEVYNEGYQPPKKVYQRIKEEDLKHWNEFKQDNDEELMPDTGFFRKLYDPRNTFTG